jgi:chromosome segregation ATPase
MNKLNQLLYRSVLIFAVILIIVNKGNSQTILPDELTRKELKEQLNYIEQKTGIYENYRAIREDMFKKIKNNVNDSISAVKSKVIGLNMQLSGLQHNCDSLKTTLENTRASLEEVTRTKESISVMGLNINKVAYNSFMWTVVAVLIGMLAVGFLIFRRNLIVTIRFKKDIEELKEEFEAYRQSSRIARDKMSMDHFNEIKKLKGR